MTEVLIESDGIDVFVVYHGSRIAKCADPYTPKAGTWVSLKPGYRVSENDYPAKLIVECDQPLATPIIFSRATPIIFSGGLF